MRFNFFSALTFLSYLFEGFLITAALDLTLNDGHLILHLYGGSLNGNAVLAAEFIAIIVFFIIGHANSTLAHLIFQQFITSIPIFRPSYYFLSFAKKEKYAPRDFHWIIRIPFFICYLIWKPFNKTDAEHIRRWLKSRYVDSETMKIRDYDRDVFSQAFWSVYNSEDKEKFDEVITNFNFSRNMLSSLLIIGFLFGYSDNIQDTAERLGLVDCQISSSSYKINESYLSEENIDNKCDQYNVDLVKRVYFIMVAILFVRFIYFFGVITKNVIRSLVRPKLSTASG